MTNKKSTRYTNHDTKNRSAGFTLVELIIVIVVIAILSAITVVGFNGIVSRSRDARRISDIDAISKALEQYYMVNNQYPVIGTGTADPCGGEAWGTRSGCTSWNTLAQALKSYLPNGLPKDPANKLGDTGSVDQKSYIYIPMQHNSDWPENCSGGTSATFQSYYLIYFLENNGPRVTTYGGCQGGPGAWTSNLAGSYQSNHISVHP